jgi:hypothetical protein
LRKTDTSKFVAYDFGNLIRLLTFARAETSSSNCCNISIRQRPGISKLPIVSDQTSISQDVCDAVALRNGVIYHTVLNPASVFHLCFCVGALDCAVQLTHGRNNLEWVAGFKSLFKIKRRACYAQILAASHLCNC